ncbi:MAG TPA: hypothetical protein VKU37_14465 [Verrucomicrobiae bacterium]|nr:hypothetical protein [Verrucomicrobiae bacterium]
MKAACAALAVFATAGQAQVTFQQITNGLVDYYPLNSLVPGNTNATPDSINRRDMTLSGMTTANIVAASHPGIEPALLAFNFTQSPGPTVIYYRTTGQNPLDGSGDFLPFIDQRGATMNFWVKGNAVSSGSELRVMGECANDGDASPYFSISSRAGNAEANYFFRDDVAGAAIDPNGVPCMQLDDGTYQLPCIGYYYNQGSQNTSVANPVLDGNWHMLTTTIDTNGDFHVFVDGIYDPGLQSGGPYTDHEGNPAIGPPLNVTNTYYTTNIYPINNLNVSNPPPNGFVRWMSKMNESGATTFGGFMRNDSISGGLPCQMSDIGFWNRVLTPAEITFVMTNGVQCPFCQPPPSPRILSFVADFSEVGLGDQVTLSWNVTGANNTLGGIVISGGVGDVSSTPVGSTNVTLAQNQTYTFTLTAHNGITADLTATVSIKTFPGVPSDWNLIQRFDGVFANTTQGIQGNGWWGIRGYYLGTMDRFNVVTVNGNKVLSPKSGYETDSTLSIGHDSPGALTYGQLGHLTMPPYQANTLFFRFSVTNPGSYASLSLYSGLDFALGLSDYNFGATGPLGGTSPPGGGATYGPAVRIVHYDPSGAFGPNMPFDLQAADYDGNSVSNSYSYVTSVDTNGLQTNATYYCWMDVSNDNTHAVVISGVSNTVQEPVYSVWLQKQGDPTRTLLFSGFHGDRDYVGYNPAVDWPTPYLNKVFMSVANEDITSNANGAFFETNNMLLLDDFYLSTNGYDATIPRLFDLNSVACSVTTNGASVSINWNSLGSMFQTNTYSVQRTFNLISPSWVTLTNGLPSGGDTTSFTDSTLGSSSTAFYRITWP